MEVLQIVGYKNSGKTTLTTSLINFLGGKGVQVASLKHHGHGGRPLGLENTDSEKHRQAGALVSGVEGEGLLQLSIHSEWDMEQMIEIFELLSIEWLVVEGFKTARYKKVVLINDKEDLHLLEQVENIAAVLTSVPMENRYAFPIFTDSDRLMDWLYRTFWLEKV